jgi:hypothetical protein
LKKIHFPQKFALPIALPCPALPCSGISHPSILIFFFLYYFNLPSNSIHSLMSDSDSALQLPVPAVTVENTDTENQGDQSDVNASNASQTESVDKSRRPRLKRSFSKGINTPSDGRKFHTIHSSDGAKFFNLENQLRELQGSNRTDSNPGSERQLTVETAIYRDQPMFTDSRRPLLVR